MSSPDIVKLTTWPFRADRVLLSILLLLAGIAAFSPQQAVVSVHDTWNSVLSILPYMALAVLLGAWARGTGADGQIARVFAANEGAAIIGAALIGALAPFCGIGVVPLVAAALLAGVPLAAVMAFWISSPLMNPAIFLLSVAEFGAGFATARLVSSIGLGLLAGYATRLLMARGFLTDALQPQIGSHSNSCGVRAATAATPIVWKFWNDAERRAGFLRELRKDGLLLLKWMVLAYLIESLIVAYVPPEFVTRWAGGEEWWAIPAAVLAGTPVYLNGYAAIPMVARLVEMGMGQGAALAFMTAGAVTCIPAMAGVLALAKANLFAWYLTLCVLGALLTGYAYQLWLM